MQQCSYFFLDLKSFPCLKNWKISTTKVKNQSKLYYFNVNLIIIDIKYTLFSNLDADLDSFHFFEHANNISEHIWIFFFKYIFAAYTGNLVIGSIFSVLLSFYFHGQFQRESLYVPFDYL